MLLPLFIIIIHNYIFFLPTYNIYITFFVLSLLEIILLTHLYNMAYVTIEEIARLFVDENKALVRGDNVVGSNHVVFGLLVGVTQDPESGTLQGDIQASQRDKTYAVKVYFSVSCFTGH